MQTLCRPKRTSAFCAEQEDTKTAPAVTISDRCEDGFFFSRREEEVRRRLGSLAGRALLLTDGERCGAFAEFSAFPRAVSLVYDGDCLPLFSMPDGISAVFATGGAGLLRAARYFAEVRGIGCVLFPVHAALEGAFEGRGEVLLAGERVQAPLKAGEVVLDCSLFGGTLADGYARTLLAQLAEIEHAALAEFGLAAAGRRECPPAGTSPEEILGANALRRMGERDGAPVGEGVLLADLLSVRGERFPAFRAFSQLTALYAAFFEKGKPRRYFTPDYRARAETAGECFRGIPAAEEYAVRAMTLERIRAPFARECLALLAQRERFRAAMGALSGGEVPRRGVGFEALKTLPEHSGGLTAVIRDFGLMDWVL